MPVRPGDGEGRELLGHGGVLVRPVGGAQRFEGLRRAAVGDAELAALGHRGGKRLPGLLLHRLRLLGQLVLEGLLRLGRQKLRRRRVGNTLRRVLIGQADFLQRADGRPARPVGHGGRVEAVDLLQGARLHPEALLEFLGGVRRPAPVQLEVGEVLELLLVFLERGPGHGFQGLWVERLLHPLGKLVVVVQHPLVGARQAAGVLQLGLVDDLDAGLGGQDFVGLVLVVADALLEEGDGLPVLAGALEEVGDGEVDGVGVLGVGEELQVQLSVLEARLELPQPLPVNGGVVEGNLRLPLLPHRPALRRRLGRGHLGLPSLLGVGAGLLGSAGRGAALLVALDVGVVGVGGALEVSNGLVAFGVGPDAQRDERALGVALEEALARLQRLLKHVGFEEVDGGVVERLVRNLGAWEVLDEGEVGLGRLGVLALLLELGHQLEGATAQ